MVLDFILDCKFSTKAFMTPGEDPICYTSTGWQMGSIQGTLIYKIIPLKSARNRASGMLLAHIKSIKFVNEGYTAICQYLY